MKAINTLLFLAIMSLVLIGCSGGEQQGTTKGAFIGGTQGITAVFEPLSVKEDNVYTVFDSEDFSLDVDVRNVGEETVAAGDVTLRLLGPPRDAFQNIPQWELKNKQQIEKISEFNPQGGEEVVSFTPNARAKYITPVTGFTDITWNLEYEYTYKTYVIASEVCFKGDLTDPKVCTVQEPKQFAVSGAPITVTAVEEDSAGKGVMLLKFTVKNAGLGKATVIGKEFDSRFDQIAYTIDEPQKWECKSGGRENEARLVEGQADVVCRLKTALAEEDVFVKQVKLTLSYVYKELVQELRVKESVK